MSITRYQITFFVKKKKVTGNLMHPFVCSFISPEFGKLQHFSIQWKGKSFTFCILRAVPIMTFKNQKDNYVYQAALLFSNDSVIFSSIMYSTFRIHNIYCFKAASQKVYVFNDIICLLVKGECQSNSHVTLVYSYKIIKVIMWLVSVMYSVK